MSIWYIPDPFNSSTRWSLGRFESGRWTAPDSEPDAVSLGSERRLWLFRHLLRRLRKGEVDWSDVIGSLGPCVTVVRG